MPIKNFVGGVIPSVDAAELNRYLIQSSHVIKPSNESVTNSATLQDDDHLALQVQANTKYWVMCLILYTGPTDPGDLQVKFSGPTGSSFKWVSDALGSGATSTTDIVSRSMQQMGNAPSFGCIAGGDAVGIPKGILQVGSNSGTFRLTWAQGTANASSTTIYARSMLMIRRLTV